MDKLNKQVFDYTKKALMDMFPIKDDTRTIECLDIIEPTEIGNDLHSYLGAINNKTDMTYPLKAKFRFNGKESTLTIADMPAMYEHTNETVLNGNVYSPNTVLKTRLGVYFRDAGDEVQSQFNVSGSKNFKIIFDTDSKRLYVRVFTKNFSLYAILRDLGLSDATIEKALGKDVFDINKKAGIIKIESELDKFTEALGSEGNDAKGEPITSKEFVSSLRLDPKSTVIVLGEEHKNVDPNLLLDSAKKTIQMYKGDFSPPSKDLMVFKTVSSAPEFIAKRISRNSGLLRTKIRQKMSNAENISDIISKNDFNKVLNGFFIASNSSDLGVRLNPIAIASQKAKITLTGEGTITDKSLLTIDAKAAQDDSFGFIDPVHTPEGGAGVTMHLAHGVEKEGNLLTQQYVDVKTGQMVRMNNYDTFFKTITFPNYWDGKNEKLIEKDTYPVMYKGERTFVPKSKVEYAIPDAKYMFSDVTNLTPLLHMIQGNRGYMAANQSEQIVSLVNPDKAQLYTEFNNIVGDHYLIKSENDGEVTAVKPDSITVSGKEYKLPEPSKLGLGSAIIYKPIVKVGDSVKKGTVLADTNFHNDGELSMGKNLVVAYTPFKGLNIEDGIVASESAAKALTSIHTDNFDLPISDNIELSKTVYKNLFPMGITTENMSMLDEDGIIKKGSKIKYGDILIAATRKKVATEEDQMLARFGKALLSQMRDAAVVFSKECPGEVISVVRQPTLIRIVVKSEKELVVGDKLTGRAGNKGIVTAILPDAEMPKTADGKPIGIVLNVIGVPSRINPAQLAEQALNKGGERRLITNFKDYVLDEAKATGSKESLFDPEYGEMKDVSVGPEYIQKMVHIVDKKISKRSAGKYTSDHTPTKGGGTGGQSVDHGGLYSLLAHGSNDFLHEVMTDKSEYNPELWKAIINGERLPAHKETFVYQKFNSILNSMGINTEKVGSTINYFPMTDKHINSLAFQEVEKGTMLKSKDLMPDKGGLFDYGLGGTKGEKWGKITLAIPVVNPLFKNNVAVLLNSTESDIDAMKGNDIYDKLKSLDLDKELVSAKNALTNSKGYQLRDKINKKIKLIYGLKKAGVQADTYMMKTVPVLPPLYRPATANPITGLVMAHDFNELYKNIVELNNTIKDKDKTTKRDDKRLQEKVDQLFFGLENDRGKVFKGLIPLIAGDSPKEGFFQSKVVKKRQDFSGRSTITPDPNLGPADIGIPKKVAMEMYKPFVIKQMRSQGYKNEQIEDEMEHFKEGAMNALKKVAGDRPAYLQYSSKDGDIDYSLKAEDTIKRINESRPVAINRAPTLHRYSFMTGLPKIHDGKFLSLNPLYLGGFNADFDGDSSINSTFVRYKKLDIKTGSWYIEAMEVVDMPLLGAENIRYTYGLVNMKDFPRGKLIEVKGNKEVYEVPEGIEVLTVWNGEKVWIKPESFHIHKDLKLINSTTSSTRSVQCSDDHSLVTVDDNLEYKRSASYIGMTVPRLREVVSSKDYELIKSVPIEKEIEGKYIFSKENFNLDLNFGYFLGVYAGDGWVSSSKDRNSYYICLASEDSFIPDKIKSVVSEYFTSEISICKVPGRHDFNGFDSYCEKHTWFSKTFWLFLEKHIGKGAENKHLPLFWMQTVEDFRWGLLSGLIDTDGSVTVTKSKGKNSKGVHVTFNTNSRRLAYEVVGLAHSLNLTSTAVPTQTPQGNEHWVVTFNHESIVIMQKRLVLQKPSKRELLSKLNLNKSSFEQKKYTPKLSSERLIELRKLIGSPRVKDRKGNAIKGLTDADVSDILCRKSLNAVVNRVEKENTSITLETAKKVFELNLSIFEEDKFWIKWKNMVLDETIDWEMIVKIEPIPFITEAYDLTIPPAYTFLTESGIVVYDTMAMHVPIRQEAVEDARKMLMNRNIFNPMYNGKIMPQNKDEQISGIWTATAKVNIDEKPIHFTTVEEARRSFETNKGQYKPDQPVIIGSENNGDVTSFGRIIINSCFPKTSRNYKGSISKGTLNHMFSSFSAQVKPEEVTERMNDLKRIANYFATKYPISVGIEDLHNFKAEKHEIMDKLRKSGDKDAIIKKTFELNHKIKDELKDKSNFYLLSNIGAKGNELQNQQLMALPGFVLTPQGGVSDHAIVSSYAEGLDIDEYINTIPGVRLGMISRSESTALPGYLGKMLINSSFDQVISVEDCGTSKGIDMKVESQELPHRLLATATSGYSKDTVMTQRIIDDLKTKGITTVHVRDPMTCEAHKGLCAKCWGVDEYGKLPRIGHQIGIAAAQALSEPITQMTMNLFHTGGLATEKAMNAPKNTGIPTGFQKVRQTFGLSDGRTGQGTLSDEDGTVSNIETNSLNETIITIGNKKYKLPPKRHAVVKIGDKVTKGQLLSDGLVNMQHMFELTPFEEFRPKLHADIKSSLHDFGFSDRTLSVVTRALTNLGEIKHPGGIPGLVEGDTMPLDQLHAINSTGKVEVQVTPLIIGSNTAEKYIDIPEGKALTQQDIDKLKLHGIGLIKIKTGKIQFTPALKGVSSLAHKKYQDPLLRMNYNRIPEVIEDMASNGLYSDTHSIEAIPKMVTGHKV